MKQVLLAKVLPYWSRESVSKCAGALTLLATETSPFETDLFAIRLLARHQLADERWLRQWMTFKAERAQGRLRLLEEVTAEI